MSLLLGSHETSCFPGNSDYCSDNPPCKIMAERAGLEPARPFGLPEFGSGATPITLYLSEDDDSGGGARTPDPRIKSALLTTFQFTRFRETWSDVWESNPPDQLGGLGPGR